MATTPAFEVLWLKAYECTEIGQHSQRILFIISYKLDSS